MQTITELAYAKINLYLDVMDKRADGYHNILTFMHTVSLADILEVSATASDRISILLDTKSSKSLCATEDNLVYKAIELYLRKMDLCFSVHVKLQKHIPVMAGLGGGSSDAAAALRAINSLSPNPLSSHELEELASQLGSDIPFFIANNAALCSGRGEILTSQPTLPPYYVLIVEGKEPSATGKAFAIIDEAKGKTKCTKIPPDFSSFSLKDVFNAFEQPMLYYCPSVEHHLGVLRSTNPLCAAMSGSGSSVYAIYKTEEEAKRATLSLHDSKTYICQLVG